MSVLQTFSHTSPTGSRGRTVPAAGGFGPILAHVSGLLEDWRIRAGQRRKLRGLDDRLLKDIGVTREQALQEADKPFWER